MTFKYVLAFALSASGSSVSADSHISDYVPPAVTIDENGIMSCGENDGNPKASAGEMPTMIANQFWSHLGCGYGDLAFEILADAPKSDTTRVPNPLMVGDDPFLTCYFDSFAYGPQYHNMTVETNYSTNEREVRVKHGFYNFTGEQFQEIQGAMMHACSLPSS